MREFADPIQVLHVQLVGVHVLDGTWSQVMASCLKQHCSPNDSHEPVVEDFLITRDLVAGPHSLQDVSTHQVVLDIDWG